MPKERMERSAADNEYLHKDFHAALSCGIQYLEQNFGPEAVKDYLRTFTKSFYAPLITQVSERGLSALKEHFENIYTIEEADFDMTCSDDELIINIAACPAVMHMREHNQTIADMWVETTRTVNEALCENTAFAAELTEYDEQTGRSVQRFYRR